MQISRKQGNHGPGQGLSPHEKNRVFFVRYMKKVRTTAAVVRTKGLLQAKALVEPVNPSTSVNQLLLAGIEGVALGADFNTNVLLGGASRKDVATRAADRGLFILGVDTFLHFVHLFLIR